jgi:hypothetical protein
MTFYNDDGTVDVGHRVRLVRGALRPRAVLQRAAPSVREQRV